MSTYLLSSMRRCSVAGARSGRVARTLPADTWPRRALTSLPRSPTATATGGVDTIGKEHKLPNLSLTEVPNLALFHHLCETTASFVHDVLRLKVVSVAPGRLTLEMAVTPEMVGNPTPATIHGGVIAAAIDHTAGFCCWSTFDSEVCSTMNLRIDYLKPLLLSDRTLILDAIVEHIDDEKNLLRTTVVCYDSNRTKQVAVGRALFNRYTPKLGVMENVKPFFRKMWGNPSLSFIAKYCFDKYKVGLTYLHKKKHQRESKEFQKFCIADERAKFLADHPGCKDMLYNGLTWDEYIKISELEPVFGDKVLGLRVLSLASGEYTSAIPFKDCFMGNFVTAAMHGGVMAALIDQTAGMCARSVVEDKKRRVSTVNFSVDYLAPAKCFEHIICETKVVNVAVSEIDSRDLIYVDATCWNEQRTVVIGVAKLTFNVYKRQS